jgi:hypothetical protein
MIIVNIDFYPELAGPEKGERSYSGELICSSVEIQGGALLLYECEGQDRIGYSLTYVERWTEEQQ